MKDIRARFFAQNKEFSPLKVDYKVSKQYIDCKKLLDVRLYGPTMSNKKQLTTRQKSKYKKNFYLDQTVKPFKNIPGPNRYVQNYSTVKRFKSQNTFITNLKEDEKSLGKRPTWIQDIQKYEQKHKLPSANSYNLQSKSDFAIPKVQLPIHKLLNRRKYNNLDDVAYLSSQVPGPGSHNPHLPKSKLKVNMMTFNMWKQKHKGDDKMLKKKLSLLNLSSFSYSPVKDKTFESIQKRPKKDASLMRMSQIQKKKGRNSLVLSPGPGAHNVINRWASQTFQKQKLVGKLNIFALTTRSFPSLSIYH